MHKLLRHQLRKLGLSPDTAPDPKGWRELLKYASGIYDAADEERCPLKQPRMISSGELPELKKSCEMSLPAILSALPDLMLLVDESGQIVEVLATGEHKLNAAEHSAEGTSLHTLFPQTMTDRLPEWTATALEKGALHLVEYEIESPQGTEVYEGRVIPTRHQVDSLRTVVFLARNITEQCRSESQSRLIQAVFEAANEGMVIMNAMRKVISVNPAFTHITDIKPSEILWRQPDFIGEHEQHQLREQIWSTVHEQGGWLGEINCRKSDGTLFPIWLTLDAVKNSDAEITHYVALISDISEIKCSQQALEHVATHDALTDLPNRVLFHDRLQHALIRSRRHAYMGAVFFFDLDRFKPINDNLGHHIGDQLLRQVAQRLLGACREEDTLARLGGDEFALIAEELSSAEDAARIAKKLVDAFSTPFVLGEYELEVTVSIGISMFPDDGTEMDQLIQQADTAMYSAKSQSRNNYRFFTQDLPNESLEYFALEVGLGKALSKHEFFLEYQPQYNLVSNQLVAVEALIRWRHPTQGLISPVDFISVAEVSGHIEPIGEWVLHQVCQQIKTWDQLAVPPFPVAINISRRQLVNPRLSTRFAAILQQHKIPGKRIEIEITESALLDREDIAYNNLIKLHELGIKLAIDDFGTGYSSLSNLKHFPLDRLKIDQSFVRYVTQNANDKAIIRATIALGQSLQLGVIAEGVESPEQSQFLMQEGCQEAQGFLFSRPVAPSMITEKFQLEGDQQWLI